VIDADGKPARSQDWVGPRAAWAAVLVQAPLLAIAGWRAKETLSCDGVSYIRLAMYYRSGRWDLAVSGYWGPLLSWLIAPWLPLFDNPLHAARIPMALSAVLFLLGAIFVMRSLELDRRCVVLGAWIVAFYSIPWSVLFIGPDLLLSGLIGCGMAGVLSRRWPDSRRLQLGTGALFGLAYLTKAVALPFAFLLTGTIAAFASFLNLVRPGVAARAAGRTLLGTLLLALPWISVLSVKYGRPVLSTSAAINHAIVGPGAPPPLGLVHPVGSTYHIPEPGRVTAWEDPSGMRYAFWSPLESLANARHQLRVIGGNVLTIMAILGTFDGLGLALAAIILGFLLPGTSLDALRRERWRWAILPVALLSSIYLPVFGRFPWYYLPAFPCLLAGAMGLTWKLAGDGPGHSRVSRAVALCLVATSFGISTAQRVRQVIEFPDERFKAASRLATRLRAADLSGTVAAADLDPWRSLYLAFIMGVPWHGNRPDVQTAEDVLSSHAALIVVSRGGEIDGLLSRRSEVTDMDPLLFHSSAEARRSPLRFYRNLFVTPPDRTGSEGASRAP